MTYVKSMADDVKAYLAENDVGTPRRDLFAGSFPDSSTFAIVVTNTGGMPPEQEYALDHPTVQVAVYAAAKDHDKAWDKIMECYRLLNRQQNITMGDSDVMYSRAVARPQSLGLDTEKKRWTFTFNVQFKVRMDEGE